MDSARREVEEALELPADTLGVLGGLLERQQVALLALAARIADEPGAAADQRDRPVAVALQAGEAHDGEQRAGVQARRGRDRSRCRR